jgi:hypothetical protein
VVRAAPAGCCPIDASDSTQYLRTSSQYGKVVSPGETVARHRRATTGTPADMAGWNLLVADYRDVRGHSSTTASNRNKIDTHLEAGRIKMQGR